MPNLKQDNLRLYRQVRLQAILHSILGAVLIFLPTGAPNPAATPIGVRVVGALIYFGLAYVLVSGAIFTGLFKSDKNYQLARAAILVATIYSAFWATLLVGIFVEAPTRSTAYIATLFGYVTYTLWYLWKDPGWRAISIVKKVIKESVDAGRIPRPNK